MSDATTILLQCIIIAGLAAMFYAVLIRPQLQRLRRHRDMLANLNPGDQIATVGGLVGKIVRTEGDNFFVVEIAPGVETMITQKSVDARLGKASTFSVPYEAPDRQKVVE